MIISCIEMEPGVCQRKAMLDILQFVEQSVRSNPACHSCGVYEGLDGNRTILYIEQWESRESFQNHVRSSSYLPVLNAIDLAQRLPKISFHEVTSTESMELIEALRAS